MKNLYTSLPTADISTTAVDASILLAKKQVRAEKAGTCFTAFSLISPAKHSSLIDSSKTVAFPKLLITALALFLLVGFSNRTLGQVTLYTESFGTGTIGNNIPFPAGWIAAGTGTWVNNIPSAGSSGYPGASGGACPSSGTGGIQTLTYNNSLSTIGYTNITILWGAKKSTSTTNEVSCDWSIDGSNWTPMTFTDVTNNANWALVNSGTRITLPVGAEGASNIQFRWTWNGTGIYYYRMDDFTVEGTPCGATSITGNPSTSTQTQCTNGTFTPITVTAAGSGSLNYQWYSNTSASTSGGTWLGSANGAQTSSYTPQATSVGTLYYYCIVSETCGNATSEVSGAFIVNPATIINSQSTATQTQCINGTFTPTTVTATGTGTLTYQWYSNTSASNTGGTTLGSANGAQTNSYTPQATTAGTLYYYCTVNGDCGSAVTSAVSDAFIVNPVTAITGQSTATQTQCINETFSPITISATGTGTLTYQWYSNTNASTTGGISLGSANGAQTNSYTPQATTVGTLYYFCIVTGTCGTASSAVSGAFIVNALPIPTLSSSDADNIFCAGTSVIFTAGGGTNYNFRVAGTSVQTGASNTYTTSALTNGQAVNVIVTNATDCQATSTSITNTVTANLSAVAISPGTAQNFCVGNSGTLLNAAETGGGLITGRQWGKRSVSGGAITDINGQTGSTYIPTGASLGVGTWYVVCTSTPTCGSATVSNEVTVTVNPLPTAAGTITGTATVCQGSNAVAYSVAAITNATGYYWTLPTGASIATGSGTNSITVNYSGSAVTGNITVYGTNTCGNGIVSPNYAVTVNPLPASAGTITGTATVCQGQNAVTYSVAAITNATGYVWTLPTGATIASGNNTRSITVNYNSTAISGIVTVYGTNTCGNGTVSSNFAVTVNPLVLAAGTITGTATVCQGQNTVAYSVPAITNATGYVWTLPTGATIASGNNTRSITVNYSGTAITGNITVYGTNTCGNGTASPNYAVTVNPLPVAAGTIAGTATVCQGQNTVAYSVPAITYATGYTWTLPSGASIASGSGTNSITVNFNSTALSGNVAVYGTNTCGNGTASPNYAVTVNPLPVAAGTITGTGTVCQGQNGVAYSVAAITNATGYVWTLPAGASIASGSNTRSITVNYSGSAVTGNLTVYGTNSCGNGTISPNYAVTVNANLSAVTIAPNTAQAICATTTGTLLTATETGGGTIPGRQWGKRSVSGGAITAISGATAQTYTPTGAALGAGTWYVVCTSTPTCGSAIVSNEVTVTVNPLTITLNPLNATSVPGSGTSFTVSTTGASPTYQWQVSTNGGSSFTDITSTGSGPAYSGWNSATLTLSGIIAGNNTYQYKCVVSSNTCTAISTAATLTVLSSCGTGGTQSFTSNGTFTVPANVTSVQVEAWGGGGAGGGVNGTNGTRAGGGGAGGAYTLANNVSVTPGQNIGVTVGAGGIGVTGSDANGNGYGNGGAGGTSTFASSTPVTAIGGNGGYEGNSDDAYGNGGAAPSGTNNGGAGADAASTYSGGGGGGAGSGSAGSPASGVTGGNGGSGTVPGGNGANGLNNAAGNGTNAISLAGGGSGGRSTTNTDRKGGDGFRGQVIVTYVIDPQVTQPANQAVCSGASTTAVTFAGSNGATQFYWTNNNTSIGLAAYGTGNIASFTAINNGPTAQVATITVTASNGTCIGTTTKNFTITVNPNVTVSVSVGASPNPVCANSTVTFTATPTNGGSTPAYQWKLNDVNAGTNSNTYTNAALVNGDVVNCVLTSNAACATGSPATSNSVTVTVNTRPVAAITSTNTSICSGGSTNLTGTITASGAWTLILSNSGGTVTGTGNGTWNKSVSPGSTTTYSIASLTDALCSSVAGDLTGSTPVTVIPNLSAVNITPSGTQNICSTGTGSTLTASETGGGTITAHQWGYRTSTGGLITSIPGATSNTYNPSGTDLGTGTRLIVCTSTPTCGSATTSNEVAVNVNANLSSVAVAPVTSQAICSSGTGSQLSVSESGGGDITHQWGKRVTTGGAITTISGATGATYTPTGVSLGNGTWYVVCTSTPACGSAIISNEVIITVNQAPAVSITGATTICAGSATSLSPITGGTWVSNNPGIASVTNDGAVTGLSTGSATFTFTETSTGCTNTTPAVTVIGTGSWLGTANTNWNDPQNWCGGVPSSSTDVVISSGVTNMPSILASGTGVCRNLTINSSATLTMAAGSTLSVDGNWANSGSFVSGTGTVDFTKSSGTQTVNNGVISFYNITHSAAGTLQLLTNALTAVNSFNNSGGGTVDLNARALTVGDLQGNGTINSSAAGAVTITAGSNNGTTTFSGVIQNGNGTVSITKNGTGTFTLSGANTYSGLTSVNVGTLKLGVSSSSASSGPLGTTVAGTTVASGASLDMNGFSLSSAATESLSVSGTGVSNLGALTNSSSTASTYIGAITFTAAASVCGEGGTIAITGTPVSGTTAVTLGGSAGGSVSTVIAGGRTLTKEGSGTWTLSGANSYTGATTISAGILKLGAAGGATNTPLGTTGSGTTVSSGASLDLNGFTLGTAEALTLNGTGISSGGALTNSSATAVTYTGTIALGSASSIGTTGNITALGVISGANLLTKIGAGTLTLSGNNTFSNGLTITEGTVQLGATNRIAATTVTMNGGTFSTGATTGFPETVGTLALTENSTIKLGTGSHSLIFAASNGVSWTGLKTLTITGWTGGYNGTTGTAGKILVGTTASGLTSIQLSQIQFYNGSIYFPATILSTGEIVPYVIATPCAYSDADNSSTVYTPCINMSTSDGKNPLNGSATDNTATINVSTSFAAHQYFVMDVIKGLIYEVYTCSAPSSALKISVYEEGVPGGTALATSNMNTGNPCSSNVNNAYLTFTAPFSGQVRVLINNASNCTATTPNGLTVKAKVIGGSNTQDDQLAEGTDEWIGHMYDGWNATKTYSQTFDNYIGSYTKTGTLNEIFGVQGTDDYCFGPLYSNGINRASIKNVTFSARFRMKSTLHGLYVVDITSDDGARATVDGNLIYDNWTVHDNTINAGVLLNLTGSSKIVVDFYEEYIDNAIIFNIISPPVLVNTLTSNTSQTVCIGNPGVTISGDVYGTLPNSPMPFGIALVGTGYQWTYSTSPGGARTNIPGATGATFTPNSSIAPFNIAGTYYIYRNGIVASTNYIPASSVSPYVATNESNAAVFTVSPPPPAAPVAQNASGLTYTGFTANWDASAGATGYYLDVSTSNTFASFVTGYNNLNVTNVTTFPVAGIVPGSYYYRVRAYNSIGGCASGNSNSITVEVLPLTYTYRSRVTGIWGASSTWDVSTDYGATWTQAALNLPPIPPPSYTDGTVTIQDSHTVYVTSNVTADQVTVNTGGAISVNPGMTLTITDGVGTDLLNNGTITALTAPFTSSAIVVNGQLANNAIIATTDYYSSGIISYGSLTISSGATLTCSPASVVSGTGDFILANGGTIEIGSSAGISSIGINTGNIKTAHVRSYGTGANYTYIGIVAQSSGNGLPSSVNNLTINNTASVPAVSLSSATQVNGSLTLTSGRLILGIKNLTLGTSAVIGGSFNSSNMIVADNTGKVIKNYNATGSFTFPLGSTANTTAYSPLTINITAGTFSSAHMDVNLHDVAHPQMPSSNYFLKRYFTFATSGISGLSYGATFNYDDLDINGNENYMNPAFFSGSTWSYPAGSVNVAGNQVTMTGLLVGGDLTAASNQTICSGSSPANITISGYTGTIQWQKSIDNFVADINNISGATSATLSSAQMGPLTVTTYYRAEITNGSVSYSPVEIVAVVQTPTTVVATEATNITPSGFTANWDISSGATGYFLDVSASNTFVSYVSGYQNLNVSSVNSYPVTVLSPGTYYYRIRAYNSMVCTTGNSNVISVSTLGNGITAGTVSISPLCVNATTSASATVAYTSYGIFSSATFTAKLSDEAGNFASTTDIGTATVSGTNPTGNINIVIPAGTTSGTGYKIRIDCTSPELTGIEGLAFEIVNGAVNVSSPTAVSSGTTAILSWTNPAGCYDEIMIVAQADSTISALPAGNGSAYTASLVYGSGTAFDGGFVVYKGSASPKTVTGLTQGKQYYFKFFTRKGTDWSSGSEIIVFIAGIECLYTDATDSNIGVVTLCANMSSNPTTISTSFAAHQYFLMNVIKGLTYEVYTCSSPSSKLKISVYAEGISTPALAASASNTGNTCSSNTNNAYLSFTSSISGVVRVLINQSLSCTATTPTGLTVRANVKSGSNSKDDQLAAGADSWVVHYYDATNQAKTYNQAFTNYIGYRTLEGTLNEVFGGNTDGNCLGPVKSNGADLAYIKNTTFSTRYRMNSTLHGLYTTDIVVERQDGGRLAVDGSLLFSAWPNPDNNTYPGVLMNLTGSSKLVVDYFDNTGTNFLGFNIITPPVLANMLSTNATQNVCLGSSGDPISGDVYGILPLGISLVGTGYQWTYSLTPGGQRFNCPGVSTGATYTPNTADAPFNAVGTYYIYRSGTVSSTNNYKDGTSTPYTATNESDAAILNVSPFPPAAPNALAASNMTFTGFSANWQSSSTATGYYLDISTSNTFETFIPGYNNRNVSLVYTFPVSGLSAGTYYYRVRAYNSAVCSSPSSNVISVVVVPVTYTYRSRTSGNWESSSTWDVSIDYGATWIPASSSVPPTPPPTYADATITIRNTHLVSVTEDVTVDQLTIETGGAIEINSGLEFTVADGAGTDLLNNGVITALVSPFTSSSIIVAGQLVNNSNIITQDFNSSGIIAYSSITINSGATLTCSPTSLVSGTGDFTLADGSSIEIGSVNGISALGTNTGNVRTTHVRYFGPACNYSYVSDVAQASGNGLPATISNLTINNTAPTPAVTLTSATQVNNNLTLTSGRLILGAQNLTLETSTTIAGSFNITTMIVADNTGKVIKNYNTTGSFTFPVGSVTNATAYSPLTIDVTTGTFISAHIDVNLHDVVHPLIPSENYYIKRYWTVAATGISGLSYGATYNYADPDIFGFESRINAAFYSGSDWSYPTGSVATAGNQVIVTGLVTGGDLTAAGKIQVDILSTPAIPTICPGSSISLYAGCDGGKSPYTFSWNTTPVQNTQTIAASPAGNTTYIVTVTDALGMITTKSIDVTVSSTPSVFAGLDASLAPGVAYTISDAETSGYPILWTSDGPGTLSDETTISPTYTPSGTETGPVTLTLTVGTAPCTSNDQMKINYLISSVATWTGGAYDGDWNNEGNWDGYAVPGTGTDVTIPNGQYGNYPTVSTTAECNNITLQSDATLVVTDGAALTVNGSASVERLIPNDWKWHFLSSPVENQQIWPEFSPTPTGSPLSFGPGPWNWDFYYWNPNVGYYAPSLPWVNIRIGNGEYNDGAIGQASNDAGFGAAIPVFQTGRGYLIAFNTDWTTGNPELHTFTGSLHSGTYNVPVVNNPAGQNAYNLLGNPYPSALDWKAADPAWDRSNIKLNGLGYDYWIFNDNIGSYGAFNSGDDEGGGTNNVDRYIAPAQAFLVEANISGTFGMTNAIRAHSLQPWLKKASTSDSFLKLKFTTSSNKYSDEMVVSLNPANTGGGTAKMWSFYGTAPELCSVKGGAYYCIDRRDVQAGESEVDIYTKIGEAGTFMITASNINQFSLAGTVTLIDMKTDISTDLKTSPSYSFTGDPADDPFRFRLVIGLTTGIDKPKSDNLIVHDQDGIITILSNTNLNGEVKVTDMAGRLVATKEFIAGSTTYIDLHKQSGVYVVSLITNKGISNVKVVIK